MSSYKEALKQLLEVDLKPKKKKYNLRNGPAVSFDLQPLERRKKPMKRKPPTPYKATISENEEFEVHQRNEVITESYQTNSSDYDDEPFVGKLKLVKKELDFNDVLSDSCGGKMQRVDEWVKEANWAVSPSASEFSTNRKKSTNWITSSSTTEFSRSRNKEKETDWTLSPPVSTYQEQVKKNDTDWAMSSSTMELSPSKEQQTAWTMSPSVSTSYQKQISISVEYNDAPRSDLSQIFDCASSDSSSSSSDIESYINLLPKSMTYSSIPEQESADDAVINNEASDAVINDEVSDADMNNEVSDAADEGIINETLKEDLYNNIIWEIPGGCIVLLNPNSPLYFHGAFVMSVLYGAVDILGHTMTPASKEIEVYSLRGSSYLFFENKCSKGEHGERSEMNIKRVLTTGLQVQSDVIENIMEKWLESAATIIFCKVLVSQKLLFLEKHVAQQLLPKLTVHELSCKFRTDPGDWNVFRMNSDWEDLAEQVDANSRVILCGGKGVGKSTLLRFLINRLLMTHAKVLVIDLDPGQPEFTVSGCVSASVMAKPVFGPNYTHLQTPERCVFVRNINISYDPSEYLNCVAELMRACTDLSTNVPTIVNYMGYSRGLGLNLIASVIQLVSPTTVVQIESARRQRNFPQKLSGDTIRTNSKLLNVNSISEVAVSYNLIVLESMTDDYEGWQMEPRIVRELGVLSYFSEMLGPNNFCLTSRQVPMYKVNLSNVCIMSGENINGAASINAGMVALCSISGAVNILKCYGWGIVRGVDTESNELYLLTPLPLNELENVTHLALGSVNLPPAVYMAQNDKAGLVPYVSLGLITNFNTIPKRSHLHKSTYSTNNMPG